MKSALEKKITEMKATHQLNLASAKELLDEESSNAEMPATEGEPMRSQLSNLVINAAVLSAVALKKSPIPGNLRAEAHIIAQRATRQLIPNTQMLSLLS